VGLDLTERDQLSGGILDLQVVSDPPLRVVSWLNLAKVVNMDVIRIYFDILICN
jgi:hypothetical protein